MKCGSSRCFIIWICRTELCLERVPIVLASHIVTYSFQKSVSISKPMYTMKQKYLFILTTSLQRNSLKICAVFIACIL